MIHFLTDSMRDFARVGVVNTVGIEVGGRVAIDGVVTLVELFDASNGMMMVMNER